MAHIKPFRGIIYNQAKIGNPINVVTPPYDIISEKMQSHFYNLGPHNIIRLILGKATKSDNTNNNKYTRAGRFLKSWLKKGILIKDKKSSIYAYKQTYLYGGKKRVRTGFITLMKIEDPLKSRILPHEYTLEKPKIDRLHLIKKVKANLSPIFSLYYEKGFAISKLLKKSIKKISPIVSVNLEGVTHQLWRLSESKTIRFIKNGMRKKKIFIADGHHRYEVALTYKKIMSKKRGYNKNIDYVMMYFTNLRESGNVTILSTHRLLKNIGSLNKKEILKKLGGSFEISIFRDLDRLLGALAKDKKRPHFGMHIGGRIYFLLALKRNISVSKVIKSEKSSHWKRLDVTILHNFILKDLLSLKDSEDNIKYVRDPKHVIKLIESGRYKIAFFLNPTKIHQVKEVAERKDMMPQKSTYFYPKLLTGLLINKF